MTKNKLKLTGDLSLKEVFLDSGQFYIPKKFRVEFLNARTRNKYKNGKPTDHVEAYVLQGIDERTANAVEQGLIDIEDVKTITIEVVGSFEVIEEAIEVGRLAFIELTEPKVKAQWVDGRNAGYKGLKLVASGIKLL